MPATGELHKLFCESVKRRRLELGLKQAEVAVKMGISTPAYCQIEIGLRVPSLTVVESVAKALRTSPAHLLIASEVATF